MNFAKYLEHFFKDHPWMTASRDLNNDINSEVQTVFFIQAFTSAADMLRSCPLFCNIRRFVQLLLKKYFSYFHQANYDEHEEVST